MPIEIARTGFNADSAESGAIFNETVNSIGATTTGRPAFGDVTEAFFDLPTFMLTHRAPPQAETSNPNIT